MAIHQGGKLKHFVAVDKRSNEVLAALWGISEATLYNYFNKEEIPSKKLRAICKVMNWDYVKDFVIGDNEDQPSGNLKEKVKSLEEQIVIMKEQLADKNEIIELLKGKEKKVQRMESK